MISRPYQKKRHIPNASGFVLDFQFAQVLCISKAFAVNSPLTRVLAEFLIMNATR